MPTRKFLTAFVVLAAAASVFWFVQISKKGPESIAQTPESDAVEIALPATYSGAGACVECHTNEAEKWAGSHHDLAMQSPNSLTVLGDFADATFDFNGTTTRFFTNNDSYFIATDGPDGAIDNYRVKYVFGVEPLQQYLLELPGGRLQAFNIAWDARTEEAGGQHWYHLYPDEQIDHNDALHWTKVSHNWNYMCAECHSTDLQKNYDLATNSYATTYSDIDVACEACHGPSSRHVALAQQYSSDEFTKLTDKGLAKNFSQSVTGDWLLADTAIASLNGKRDTSIQIETCAQCHSRRTTIAASAVHRQSFYDSHQPVLLEQGLYHSDGQINDEVYVYGSFMQSKMYEAGVTCTDCHDAHSLKLHATGNNLCAQCHQPAVFDTPGHHNHTLGSEAAECVTCHMPTKSFMVVDPRRDHSFRIPRPDLTVKTGSPNVCSQCHGDESTAWAVDSIATWSGSESNSKTVPLHFGEALHAGQNEAVGAKAMLQEIARDSEQPAIARATATAMLGNYPVQESINTLRVQLNAPDPLSRIAALNAFASIPPQEAFAITGRLLADPIKSVRITAARLLANVPTAGLTAEQLNELNSAVEEYIQVQLENADRGFAHTNLGALYVAIGELQRAESEYQKAIEIEPDFIPAYVNLADYYRQIGNEKQAEVVLRQAVDINPDVAVSLHALGLSLARQGRYDEALEALKQAAARDTTNSEYQYVYAIAQSSVGDNSAALDTLRTGHERWPGNRQMLITLATLNKELGNSAAARRYASKLLELVPDDESVRQFLRSL